MYSLSGEQILAMVYGYEVQGRNDDKVNVAKEMASLVSETALPGVLLVNDIPLRKWASAVFGLLGLQRFPIVRYVPEWLSWLSYKPLARYGHNLGNEVMNGPMRFVKESIVRKHFVRSNVFLERLFSFSTMALLDRHSPLKICKKRRSLRDQNAKRQRRQSPELWDRCMQAS